MGEVHELIRRHGLERAKEVTPRNRHSRLDAAYAVMTDEMQKVGITYSGFCLTSLPHKRIPDDQTWVRDMGRISLVVEPGSTGPVDRPHRIGVPYGSRARLILFYLQTEALRGGSPEVELGRSMHVWMGRMGVPIGGKSYRDVKEQAVRLSHCRLTFWWELNSRARGFKHESLIDGGITLRDDDRQEELWVDTVRLSDRYFRELREHPVPVAEAALRQLANNSAALDVYCWLAWRLHRLEQPTPVTWGALHAQFGAGYREARMFRHKFKEFLDAATAVYEDAKVVVSEQGLVLHPSRSPVPERQLLA
jgi:hypothetical protein